MYLVHPKKHGHGKWEVAWTWIPFFLASDNDLIKSVDLAMTELFKGQTQENGPAELMEQQMHEKVLELILEKYPIPGLRGYLEAVMSVTPEVSLVEKTP